MLLTDCSPISVAELAAAKFSNNKSGRQTAAEWLARLSRHDFSSENFFCLTETSREKEPVVYADMHGRWWTGRYIGSICFEGITIEIQPRFGLQFVANNIPLNNFTPVMIEATFGSGEKFIHLLQALLWLNLLNKAAKHSAPSMKVERRLTSQVARGKIDVRGTLREQLKDRTKIVSITSYKELKNPISDAVVLAFFKIKSWFPEHDLMHWMPEAIAIRLQQMIQATPNHSRIPKPKDIEAARLGSIARLYKPLARLSLEILKNKGLSERHSENENQTFLLDVAELWEVYVLDVLREAYQPGLSVVHGTHESSEYLLTSKLKDLSMGKLLPDFIFYKNKEPVLLGDAKYKKIGDAPWMSPKRDDLYQMTAYLAGFSKCKSVNVYYPEWGDEGSSCQQVTASNPWCLDNHKEMNFYQVPIDKKEAIRFLKEKSMV